MKIYFAASILGSQTYRPDYLAILEALKKYGTVLTEHVGQKASAAQAEEHISPKAVHDRDVAWVMESDVVVAEVSNPSLGVGYEIGRAVEHRKRVICFHHKSIQKISFMIAGNSAITVYPYENVDELCMILEKELYE